MLQLYGSTSLIFTVKQQNWASVLFAQGSNYMSGILITLGHVNCL